MGDEWIGYGLMMLAGVSAGIVNTLAGNGSIFVLSSFLFMGLPVDVANGTNRVGVLWQSIVATWSFKKQNSIPIQGNYGYLIPSLLGALLGAFVAVGIERKMLEIVMGCVMVFMLVVMLVDPQSRAKRMGKSFHVPAVVLWVMFFFIGFYGGIIQAGVGVFIMTAFLSLTSLKMLEANGLKTIIVLLFSAPVLAIFVYSGKVHWQYGIWIAVWQGVGAWLASKFALFNPKAPMYIKWLLYVMIIVSIVKLFGIWEWVKAMF